MELFTAVVASLATNGIKSLVRGELDRDALASAAAEVLGVVISQQAETNDTLRRVEEKVDRLALQNYELPLEAGFRFLTDAQPERRAWPERKSLLDAARTYFVEASVAAPDPISKAIAEWHAGMAWLLGGSLQDSLISFERASDLAFKGLTDARYDMEEWDESELTRMAEQAAGPALLYYRLTGGISDTQRSDQYRARQAERAPLVSSALEVAQGIQATRRELGVPPEESAPPYALTSSGYEVVVILQGRPDMMNEVLGFTIGIHSLRVLGGGEKSGEPFVLDADLSLGAPAGADEPRMIVRALRDLGSWREWWDPVKLPSTPLPRIEGTQLLAGDPFSPGGEVTIPRGQITRGWLRLASATNPELLTFRFWPFERRGPSDRGVVGVAGLAL